LKCSDQSYCDHPVQDAPHQFHLGQDSSDQHSLLQENYFKYKAQTFLLFFFKTELLKFIVA